MSRNDAVAVIAALEAAGSTVATAESLTGGMLGAELTAVPGASIAYRGGVIAYATELKATLLAVDRELLAAHGAVHADVAMAMARGVSRLCDADYGLATTGVAGPDWQDGQSPGTVFVAMCEAHRDRCTYRRLALHGTRAEIRQQSVQECLRLLLGDMA